MLRTALASATLVSVLVLAACSGKSTDNSSATAADAGNPALATPAAPMAAAAPAGNACDRKLITAADVAPLLGEPISSEKAIPGDAQSCEYDTADFSSVHISMRPGLGNTTVTQVKSGATNQTVTSLTAVGDSAVWDPTLKQVDATKNNLLCEIGAMGPATKGATSDKIGALCNKIFAAN